MKLFASTTVPLQSKANFEENLMEQQFKPNTSFSNEKQRERQSFSSLEHFVITMLKHFYMLLPLKYFKVKQSMIMCLNRLRHRHIALPNWFFRLSGFSDEHEE